MVIRCDILYDALSEGSTQLEIFKDKELSIKWRAFPIQDGKWSSHWIKL